MDVPTITAGQRRNEDIALDLMKFIAATTGYGRTHMGSAGFKGEQESKADEYAKHLLELYGKCLHAIQGK